MGSKACSAGHRYAKCDEEFEAVEEKNCEGLSLIRKFQTLISRPYREISKGMTWPPDLFFSHSFFVRFGALFKSKPLFNAGHDMTNIVKLLPCSFFTFINHIHGLGEVRPM